jgi:transposase-like protein DUF772
MFPSREGEQPPDPGFYERLRQHLTQIVFDQRVSALWEPLYWRPYLDTNIRIDPVVYFKMLMVGFLENLSSERAIAARCSDSLSVRALLGYDSKEATPGEPELCAIRHRLESRVYEEVLVIILLALKSHGLLDGETIDPEIIDENTNLRGLIGRNTEYVCRSYFDELTRQPRVVPPTTKEAQAGVAAVSYQRALSAPRVGTSYERSADAHEARWCRRIAGRG